MKKRPCMFSTLFLSLFVLISSWAEEKTVTVGDNFTVKSDFVNTTTTTQAAQLVDFLGWWPDANGRLDVESSIVRISSGSFGVADAQGTCQQNLLTGPFTIDPQSGRITLGNSTKAAFSLPAIGAVTLKSGNVLGMGAYKDSTNRYGVVFTGESTGDVFKIGKLKFDQLFAGQLNYSLSKKPLFTFGDKDLKCFKKEGDWKISLLNSSSNTVIYDIKSTQDKFDSTMGTITFHDADVTPFGIDNIISVQNLKFSNGKYPTFTSAQVFTKPSYAMKNGQLEENKIVFGKDNLFYLGLYEFNLGGDKVYCDSQGLYSAEANGRIAVLGFSLYDLKVKSNHSVSIKGGGATIPELKGVECSGAVTAFSYSDKNNWDFAMEFSIAKKDLYKWHAGGQLAYAGGKLQTLALKGGGESKKKEAPCKLRIKDIDLKYETEQSQWSFNGKVKIGWGDWPNFGSDFMFGSIGLRKFYAEVEWEKSGFEMQKEILFLKSIKLGAEKIKTTDPLRIKGAMKLGGGREFEFPFLGVDKTRLVMISGEVVINIGDLFYIKGGAQGKLLNKFDMARLDLAVGEIPDNQGRHLYSGLEVTAYVNIADIIYGDAAIWCYKMIQDQQYYVGMKLDAGVRAPRGWRIIGGKTFAHVNVLLCNKAFEFGVKIAWTRWTVRFDDKGWSLRDPQRALRFDHGFRSPDGSVAILTNYRELSPSRRVRETKNMIMDSNTTNARSNAIYKSSNTVEYEIKKTDSIGCLLTRLDYSDYPGDAFMTIQFPDGTLHTPDNAPALDHSLNQETYKKGATPIAYQDRKVEATTDEPALKECGFVFRGPKQRVGDTDPLQGAIRLPDDLETRNFGTIKPGIYKVTVYGTEDEPPAMDSNHFTVLAENNQPALAKVDIDDLGDNKYRVRWEASDIDQDDVRVRLWLGDSFETPEDDLSVGKLDGYSLKAGETSAEFDLDDYGEMLGYSRSRYLFLSVEDDYEGTRQYVFVKELPIPAYANVPSIVKNVSVTSQADGSLDVAWDKLDWTPPEGYGFTSYSVVCQEIGPDGAVPQPIVYSTDGSDATSLNIKEDLIMGREYWVWVSAVSQKDIYAEDGTVEKSEIFRGIPSVPVKAVPMNSAVNCPPQFLKPIPDVAQVGKLYEAFVQLTDSDNDYTSVELVGETIPKGIKLSPYMNQWKIAFTPTADQVGYYPLTLVAKDNRGGESHHDFTLAVVNAGERVTEILITNAPPTNLTLGDTLSFQLSLVYYPSDSLPVFEKLTGPEGMRITPSGMITWTPTMESEIGQHVITVQINLMDRNSQTRTATETDTFVINVNVDKWSGQPALPSAPSPRDYAENVSPDTPLSWQFCLNTDVYDLYLWRANETCPSQPTASNLTKASWTPSAPLANGSYRWKIVAKNKNYSRAGADWYFSTDSRPCAADDTASTPQGDAVDIPVLVNDSDPNSDSLTVIRVGATSNGTLSILDDGATIRYTPSDDFFGIDKFYYVVSDGNGGDATAHVTVAVDKKENQKPIVYPTITSTPKNTPVYLNPLSNTSDPEGERTSIVGIKGSIEGTVKLVTTGSPLLYIPQKDFTGDDCFTIIVADTDGGTAEGQVMIRVTNVKDTLPVPSPDHVVALSGQATTINALANDQSVSKENLSIIAVTSPRNGEAIISDNGRQIIYQSSVGYIGEDSFRYTIANGQYGTATGDVTVAVVTEADYLAFGSIITVRADELKDLSVFKRAPKIYAQYQLPFSNGPSQRSLFAALDKATKREPLTEIRVQWKTSTRLFDPRRYAGIQLGPKLVAEPMNAMRIDTLMAQNDDSAATRLNRILYIMPPRITATSGTFTTQGDKMIIQGKYFGETPPKIMMECEMNGRFFYRTCKLESRDSLKFKNGKGENNKSCMKILADDGDQEVGYCEVTVVRPKIPERSRPTGYIILNNKSAMCSFRYSD